MSTANDERRPADVRLPGELRWLLARLRWAIRAYAWIDGLATAAIWLGAAFFLLWLYDWAFEPSWNVRQAAMCLAAVGLAAIVYRLILRRSFARLPRTSLAALVERHHGEFGDRLLTAVSLCDRPATTEKPAAGGDASAERERGVMLEQTVAEARTLARNVRVRRVFNGRPLVFRSAAAFALLAAFAMAWFVAGDALAFYLQRLAGSPEPWPRKTVLLVEGFWAEYAIVVPESSPPVAEEVHVYTGAVEVEPRGVDTRKYGEPIAVAAGAAAHVAENGAMKATTARGIGEIVEPLGELDRFAAGSDAGGVAVLRRAVDCLWRGDARAYRAGAKLSLGRYELISGRAEIVMNGGTRLVVAGPAAFEIVGSTKVVLDYGRTTVRAPLRPAPFVVETPRATYTASPVDEIKVVRGGDATLTVLADALRMLPEFVEAAYEGESGGEGRQMLQQEAAAIPGRDEFQRYTLALKNVLGSLELDIRGGDGRVSGVKIATVDSPKLVVARAACRFPGYLVDAKSGRFTPRSVDISGPLELPVGTDVTLHARASKPLRRVDIAINGEKKSVDVGGGGYEFAFALGPLERTTAAFLTLHDADGVANREAIPLQLVAVPDEPPRAAVKLVGVGSTVTPNALLRLQGEIADDHALDRAWFAIAAAGEDATQRPLAAPVSGERRIALATKPWRGEAPAGPSEPSENAAAVAETLDLGGFRLPSGRALKPGDQLMVSVRAVDRCDLREKPAVGESDRVPLEVVTVDDLLGRLEAREVLIRDKLATIIEELEQTRDALGELKPRSPVTQDTTSTTARRQMGPQVERAAQNGERSSYETATVANALDEMGEELVTNRLDTSERRARLADKLIVPLRAAVAEGYPKFDAALAVLRQRAVAADQLEQLRTEAAALKEGAEAASKDLADRIAAIEARLQGEPPTEQLVAAAQREADQIVVALRAVLGELADAGDFNQLVEELREIGKRQQQLRERTRKEQQKSLLE
ncbi:MAG: hypothetical protein DCC68_20955 [Planctomycetota bacterium]|nr:MAG: hypothetical protein DCC68_20955 [Planctomycetota bacterium]